MKFRDFLLLHEEEPITPLPSEQEPEQIISVMRVTIPGIKELRDGLTEETIRTKFPWFIKSQVSDAIIGTKNGKLVFYGGSYDGEFHGIWENGKFKGNFEGLFKSGTFDGTFLGGTFISGKFSGEFRQGDFIGTFIDGVWKGGTFSGGTFKEGLFERGFFKRGTFSGGTFKGTFSGGTFAGGTFDGGQWLGGKWSGKGTWIIGKDKVGDIIKSPPEEAR